MRSNILLITVSALLIGGFSWAGEQQERIRDKTMIQEQERIRERQEEQERLRYKEKIRAKDANAGQESGRVRNEQHERLREQIRQHEYTLPDRPSHRDGGGFGPRGGGGGRGR